MKIALGWSYWIVYQLLAGPLWVLGWIIVPPLAICHAWEQVESTNPMFPGKVWTWKGGWLTLIWGNSEDGVVQGRANPTVLASILWCCWRNPTNNMRLLPFASFLLDADPVVSPHGKVTVITAGWRQAVVWDSGWRIGWLLRPDFKRGWRSWPVIGK